MKMLNDPVAFSGMNLGFINETILQVKNKLDKNKQNSEMKYFFVDKRFDNFCRQTT